MSSQPSSACPFARPLGHPPRSFADAAALAFALFAYAAFLACITYAIGFVGNWLVPKSIDSGKPGSLATSLLVNTLLLSVFVLQHTIMARPGFKAWWTRIVPKSLERSIFVLCASAALGLVFWLWRPLPQVLWSVEHPAAAVVLSAISLLGWGIVFTSSFMVSHFELFGLRQVWQRWSRRPLTPVGFRLVGLYRLVRHPLMLGFLIAFWFTPTMTIGHLFFAAMTTAYIRLGTWFEERDLIREHGDRYLAYRRSVRGLIPLPVSRTSIAALDPALTEQSSA